jgi:hypothetical protein
MIDHHSKATRGGVITVTETFARKVPCVKCQRQAATVTSDGVTWLSRHGGETHQNMLTASELFKVFISCANNERLDGLAAMIASEKTARDKMRSEQVV